MSARELSMLASIAAGRATLMVDATVAIPPSWVAV
jgi:hypothetical protein